MILFMKFVEKSSFSEQYRKMFNLFWLCMLSSSIYADTITFQQNINQYTGTKDISISNQYAAAYNNYNGVTYKTGSVSVGFYGGYEFRGLIKFEGLTLPKDASIVSATLTTTWTIWSSGYAVNGYYLKNSWNPNDSMGWSYRDKTSKWAKQGANGEDLDFYKAGSFVVNNFSSNGKQVKNITLDNKMVENWILNPSSNQGILLTSTKNSASFAGSEDSTSANRAKLTIVYTITPPQELTRRDSEPSGNNCLYSGTAVHTGLDYDRNSVLTDDEILSTVYECEDPFTDTDDIYDGNEFNGKGGIEVFQQNLYGYIGTQDIGINNTYSENGYSIKSGSMNLYQNSNGISEEIIRFDSIHSVLPKDSTITRAILNLTVDSWQTDNKIYGYYLKSYWNPVLSNIGCVYRNTNMKWASNCISNPSEDILSNSSFSIDHIENNGTQQIRIYLDPEIVNGWILNPSSNNGLLLTQGIGSSSSLSVHGAEDSIQDYKPKLTLLYQVGDVEMPMLTRNDIEPRGKNCTYGGTAIRTGHDFDASNSLSDNEVESTSYKCSPPVFYVSTTGTDEKTSLENGSEQKPWASIGYAVMQVPDNSLILVKEGTYNGEIRLDRFFEQGVTIKSEIPYKAKLRNNASIIVAFGSRNFTIEGFDMAHTGPDSYYHIIHAQGDYTQYLTFRNNIIHDSYLGDLFKADLGASKILIEKNMFYNAQAKQIFLCSSKDVIIQDNVFFSDLQGSGRENKNTSSSFIAITNYQGSKHWKSEGISVRRNVFFNWEGSIGQNFILLGGDAMNFYEASDILIENNLMIGNSINQMRAPIGLKGAEDVMIVNNTLTGNMLSDAFFMRSNVEGESRVNNNIYAYNNIFSDPTGTMNKFTTTPYDETDIFELKNNLYWNNGNEIPVWENQIINVDEDMSAVFGNPFLETQENFLIPRWNENKNLFADGSSSIEMVKRNIVLKYGKIPSQSAGIDNALPEFSPTFDILGTQRNDHSTPDMGSFEFVSDDLDPSYIDTSNLEDETLTWQGGWIQGYYPIVTTCENYTEAMYFGGDSSYKADFSLLWEESDFPQTIPGSSKLYTSNISRQNENGGVLTYQKGSGNYNGTIDLSITDMYADSWNNYNGTTFTTGDISIVNTY